MLKLLKNGWHDGSIAKWRRSPCGDATTPSSGLAVKATLSMPMECQPPHPERPPPARADSHGTTLFATLSSLPTPAEVDERLLRVSAATACWRRTAVV